MCANIHIPIHTRTHTHIPRPREGERGVLRDHGGQERLMMCALTFGFPLAVQQRPRHGASSVGWRLFGEDLGGRLADCRCHTSNLFLCSMSAEELQWLLAGCRDAGWLAESRRTRRRCRGLCRHECEHVSVLRLEQKELCRSWGGGRLAGWWTRRICQ